MKSFEWDENKRDINLSKHGIDFVDAIKVFKDLQRIEFESTRGDEPRIMTIGIVHEVVILVVYVKRNNKKRIISGKEGK